MRFAVAACMGLFALASPALAAPEGPAAATTKADAAVDPARLAAARRTVDYVFPTGTYARMLNGTMDKMMDSMMDSMMKMPVRDLAGISGVDASKLGPGTTAQIMEIYDPVYRERMRVTTHAMMGEMSTLMTRFEPDIREGLSHAYAAKYDVRQLGELNAFFATPTGRQYAADSYLIMMSPEVMSKMQAFVPELMKQMPAIVEKVKAKNASLPPVRKYADLSDADKTKLAGLLGISRQDLDKSEATKAHAEPSP